MEKLSSNYLIEKLQPYDKVVIYGAGLYGELFLKRLYELKIYKRTVFAVTGTPQVKEVLGHEVLDIASFAKCKENFVVVLAVGVNLNLELKNNLNKLNISSYIELDDNIRRYLKTEISSSYEDTDLNELIQEIYSKLQYLENRLSKLETNLIINNENSLKLDKIYNFVMEKYNE